MLKDDRILASVVDFRNKEYVVKGRVDPADGHRLCKRLLRDRSMKRKCSSGEVYTRSSKDFLVAYMRPNRQLVLEVRRSGRFRLGVGLPGDGSEYVPFPAVSLSEGPQFELAYHLMPFLVFGSVGNEISISVLSALVRKLKNRSAFRVLGIEFPTLVFMDALRLEARDIERRINKGR